MTYRNEILRKEVGRVSFGQEGCHVQFALENFSLSFFFPLRYLRRRTSFVRMGRNAREYIF